MPRQFVYKVFKGQPFDIYMRKTLKAKSFSGILDWNRRITPFKKQSHKSKQDKKKNSKSSKGKKAGSKQPTSLIKSRDNSKKHTKKNDDTRSILNLLT
ncbi:hypothetical protein RhiirA4_481097 [Rhizophagus irregularis]|uniref:Uncharacterized protein n=1 Tax=Rhizophagus irregularis TaxID=588596 RepID=A0A2I1HJ12_9GLOM|nr:hypothetical protein RhiirA4_481097 [Rhizophagus irregularis]